MFDDDMSALLEYDSNGKAVYSFFNLNSIYDFLLSIGMKPYVELSFMPGPLASNSTYVMRYLVLLPPVLGEWQQVGEAATVI
jgi:xylan 1,4-beta-xylosidase